MGEIESQGNTSATEKRSVFAPEYRSITLSTLTLVAVAAFDGMAVPAVLSGIGADLGVRGLPWVLTGFSLTSAIALLAVGPLIDAFGVRRMFRSTLVIFFAGSVGCAVAPTLAVLVGARSVQGVGGGMVMAVSLANVGLAYPPELRSRAFAVNSAVWGVMAVAGPAAAAGLMSVMSWRSVFIISLPIVAVAGAVGWKRIPASGGGAALRFDGRGLLIAGLFTLVLLLSADALAWWSVAGLVAAALLGWMYWRHSGRVSQPILDRRHFARWPFGPLNLIPLTFFAGSLSIDGYLPIFVRGAMQRSNASAAFTVAFLAVGWSLGSQIASRVLDHVDNTVVMTVGFAFTFPPLVIGVFAYRADVALWVVFALSFVQGLGVGSMTNATVTMLQRSAGADEIGRVSAAHQFCRHFGVTIGAALSGAVIFAGVSAKIGTVEPVRQLLDRDDDVDVALSDATSRAIAYGFRWATAVAAVITLIGFITALYVRRRFVDERRSSPSHHVGVVVS